MTEAIEKFPNHYFLKEYLEHVDYLLSDAYEEDRIKLESVADEEFAFGMTFAYDKGSYLAFRAGRPVWICLPRSLSKIKVMDKEHMYVELIWEKGEIKGFEWRDLDYETMELSEPYFAAKLE